MADSIYRQFGRPATYDESAWLLGPVTAGAVLSFVLYGIYLVLHTQYVTSSMYARLGRPVKATIWLVARLLTIHVVMTAVDVVDWTTMTDRTLGHLIQGSKLKAFTPAAGGAVAVPVQVVLLFRTSTMLRNQIIRYTFLAIVGCGILVTFVGAISCTVGLLLPHYGKTLPGLLDSTNTYAWWLWGAAGVDVCISLALALTLRQRVAGFNKKTDSLLYKLILSALQTASYTTVLAVIGAVLTSVYGSDDFNPRYTLISVAFGPPLPTCYGISLFTTLATRRTIDEHFHTSTGVVGSVPLQSAQKSGGLKPEGMAMRPMLPRENSYGGIEVTKSVEVEVEMGEEEEENGRRRMGV
ncbi:hypothetical protein JCM8097_001100 [Rhodosporidiobolus ruineniae]